MFQQAHSWMVSGQYKYVHCCQIKPRVCSVRLIQSTLTKPNLYMLISLCNSVLSCPLCLITPPCPLCQSSLCPLLVCWVTLQGAAKISSLKSCRWVLSTDNLNCFESVGIGRTNQHPPRRERQELWAGIYCDKNRKLLQACNQEWPQRWCCSYLQF